jgi:flagellar hook-length control protein FliK
MTATFQTSNEDATRLLSHSLGQLKTALESQGVTVEKIQVQQSPKDSHAKNGEDSSAQQQRDEANARQENDRREMLRKMWRRVSGTADPVDLVA